jgi:AcrR family transcriptional regulator
MLMVWYGRNDPATERSAGPGGPHDQRILEAARQVFVADPAAPIGAAANQAGVGMSALYRRYHSKEELLARLAGDGLRRYITEAEAALADHEARRRLGGRYRYDSSHRRRNPWLPTRRRRRPDSLATQCRHA